MNTSISSRIASFFIASVMTVFMLAAIDKLADTERDGAAMAAAKPAHGVLRAAA
jgi:hypothetical protein